jgi:hypothetical protein
MLALPSGIFSELFGFAQLLSSIAHATLFSIDDFQNILAIKICLSSGGHWSLIIQATDNCFSL